MGRHIIPFELRPGKDDDIKKALAKEAHQSNRSQVIRQALRAYLFKPKTRQVRTLEADSKPAALDKKEKADDEVSADLDNLLKDF